MAKAKAIKVHFHVGLGKTGTTFLQYRVFPYFKGIHYIQRTKYKKAIPVIQAARHPRYLVSREFDQQLEQEVVSFSRILPDTRPIIVFRRHDSYIASQYRRFVKNGFTGGFSKFFDIQHDSGYFKKKDLDYSRQINLLEQHFNYKPLVLIYEDLKEQPEKFIQRLADELDVSVNIPGLDLSRKHTSYSEKQLKAMLALGNHINMTKRRVFENSLLHLLWRLSLGSIRYATLYTAKLLPERFFADGPLIPPHQLDEVRAYYQEDWEKCLIYAQQFDKLTAD